MKDLLLASALVLFASATNAQSQKAYFGLGASHHEILAVSTAGFVQQPIDKDVGFGVGIIGALGITSGDRKTMAISEDSRTEERLSSALYADGSFFLNANGVVVGPSFGVASETRETFITNAESSTKTILTRGNVGFILGYSIKALAFLATWSDRRGWGGMIMLALGE